MSIKLVGYTCSCGNNIQIQVINPRQTLFDCSRCKNSFAYNDILDEVVLIMANPGFKPFIPKTHAFKHKCVCNSRFIVYAIGTPPTFIHAFYCPNCKSEFAYDFKNSHIQTIVDNYSHRYTSQPITATQHALNNFARNIKSTAQNRLMVEGWSLYEMHISHIYSLGAFEFAQHLTLNGIKLDVNTKIYESPDDAIRTYLQIPVDFIPQNYELMKAVTSNTYAGIYLSWCLKNSQPPMKYDLLAEFFKDCQTNDDYAFILDLIMTMNLKNPKDVQDALNLKLRFRLELFNRIPSGTNMMLAYQIMEDLTLKKFEASEILMDETNERLVSKFDKCKSLALDTKHINERKIAFEKSLDFFKKLTKIELK